MNIYFTSDTHWGHKNLVYGVSEWEDKEAECRKFDTLEEHNETLIQNINKVVQAGDTLYHMGDWTMGATENIYEFRKSLNVRNLHLILGNHDVKIAKNPIVKIDKGYTNVHNLFNSVNQLLETKVNGQRMSLCHYAMRTWGKAAYGAWNLHGHSHGNLPHYLRFPQSEFEINNQYTIPLYKSLDVGIDTHPEFRPYHFDEIAEIFDNKQFINFKEDHHGE